MTEWGKPCSRCGHPSTFHGASFCLVRVTEGAPAPIFVTTQRRLNRKEAERIRAAVRGAATDRPQILESAPVRPCDCSGYADPRVYGDGLTFGGGS